MSKPRAITDLLAEQFSGPVEQAIQRGRKLGQLSRFIQKLLVPELAAHCQLLNLRQGVLIMSCDSTVWATRLRYQVPALLESLRQQDSLRDLVDIQIRVNPVVTAPQQATRRRASLSAEAAYCVQQCAESIDDSGLRQALEQLAGRRRDDS